MSDATLIDKGGKMEEILRNYFLESGYFVVRGAKYYFEGQEITDIDLWLYQRTSTFSRERYNVDIKNRRSPQALERILWAKGLQQSLNLDGALVATTDTRSDVSDFGHKNDIVILDGSFLSRLKQRYANANARLTEEEFISIVREDKSDRIGGDWLDRNIAAKARILTQLNFDGCNAQLVDTKYFADQVSLIPHRRETICRLFYQSLGLALLTLDFLVRDFAFVDRPVQTASLNDGLRFGDLGEHGADKMFYTAARIASLLMRGQNAKPADLVKQIRAESMQLPVEILSEFVLKLNQSRPLFELARQFEFLGYNRTFQSPLLIATELRGVIGAVLDFHSLERRKFFDGFAEKKAKPSMDTQSELPIPQATLSEPNQPEDKKAT